MKYSKSIKLNLLTVAVILMLPLLAVGNEKIAKLLNSPEGWERDVQGQEKIIKIDNPQAGKCLEFWHGIAEGAKGVHFRKRFSVPQDFSKFETITFMMKGNGLRNALKIGLMDQTGIMRMYGPFWTDSKEWRKFEFIPQTATWKGAKDKLFRLNKVKMFVILQDFIAGKPKISKPVFLKDIACPSAEENKKFTWQWVNEGIDKNGNIILNGKKFFPVGLYSLIGVDGASSKLFFSNLKHKYSDQYLLSLLSIIRKAGFNTIQSYTVPYFCSGRNKESRIKGQEKLLKMAEKAGLKVMLNIYYLSNTKIKGNSAQVKAETAKRQKELIETIQRVKKSPALIAYYIADEPFPAGMPRQQLETFYRVIKKYDKKHPVVLVECSLPGFPMYKKAADIMAPDCYPVDANKNPDIEEIAKKIDSVKNALSFSKPYLWNVIQIQKAWDKSKPFENLDKARYPTAKELRSMVYLSIVEDVKGIFCFSLGGNNKQPVIFDKAPETWEDISKVLNSINTVLPAIFSVRKDKSFTVSNSKVLTLGKIVNMNGGKYLYIIAVLPSDGKTDAVANVAFNGIRNASGNQIEVLDEDKNGSFTLNKTRLIQGNRTNAGNLSFSDKFENNIVHVYRINISN